jgi:hypothetical protein
MGASMRAFAMAAVFSLVGAIPAVAQGPCGWVFYDGCLAESEEHKVQGPSDFGWTILHGDCRVCLWEFLECHPPVANRRMCSTSSH